MKKFNKCLCILLITLFVLPPIYAETPFLEIHTKEAFLEFAEQCKYDAYSEELYVKLMNDIDLDNVPFDGIASFSGTFDGENHTIKNLSLTHDGSKVGLFRYIEEKGVVKDLYVEGSVKPIGTESYVGGIAGVNKGLITNVHFTGAVEGAEKIGGLVGMNETTGSILKSDFNGDVLGEYGVGGIAGENRGYIERAINHGEVNTTQIIMRSPSIMTMDLKSVYEGDLTSSDQMTAQTDAGGIVGYNVGIIKRCTNYGKIGYNHVGYNIGGIAGRHSGYISDSVNHGLVQGRKDVGGIVGQFEPFVKLLFSREKLTDLSNAIDDMHEALVSTVDTADAHSTAFSNQLDVVVSQMDSVSDNLEVLLNDTTDYVDDTTEQVNEGLARVKKFIKQSDHVVEEFKLASEQLTLGLDEIEKAFDELSDTADSIGKGTDDLSDAFDDLDKAAEDLLLAFDHLILAMEKFEAAAESSPEMEAAKDDINAALDELELASSTFSDALEIIEQEINDKGSLLLVDWQLVSGHFTAIGNHLETAMPLLNNGFRVMFEELEKDRLLLSEGFSYFKSASQDLRAMSVEMREANKDIKKALDHFTDASASAEKGMDYLSDSAGYLSTGSDHLTQAFENLDIIVDYHKRQPDIVLPTLGEYVDVSSETLFNDISSLNDELSRLNDISSQGRVEVMDELKTLDAAYNEVAFHTRDIIDSLSFEAEDKFIDVSEEAYEVADALLARGIVKTSENYGDIYGDIDVAGIAGAMAVEVDFDPEDDIVRSGKSNFNFKYQSKALLLNSVNKGAITGKKDYIGGIVGRMDVGLISASESYATILSEDGSYVGGIAGQSNRIIQKSYAMNALTGKKFVGGIAGEGQDIRQTYSMTKIIDGLESVGAVAGQLNGEAIGNKFVYNGYHGIDDISYKMQAVPEDYASFVKNDLPDEFKNLTITLVIDGNVVKELPFAFMGSIEMSDLPTIPQREGFNGEWPFDDLNDLVFSETYEAVYKPYVRVIASDDNPQPEVLVEGFFDEHMALSVKATDGYVPKGNESIIKEWQVSVNADDSNGLKYRVLKPGANNIKLYLEENGIWQEIKTESDGSYLTFESGKDIHIVTVAVKQQYMLFIIIGALLFISIITMLLKKKKKLKLVDA